MCILLGHVYMSIGEVSLSSMDRSVRASQLGTQLQLLIIAVFLNYLRLFNHNNNFFIRSPYALNLEKVQFPVFRIFHKHQYGTNCAWLSICMVDCIFLKAYFFTHCFGTRTVFMVLTFVLLLMHLITFIFNFPLFLHQ